MSAGPKTCKGSKGSNVPSTLSYGSRIHVCVVLLAGGSDWSLSIANFDDADDEYDEYAYDGFDTFGDYNAHTLAEIDQIRSPAGSSTFQQLTTPLVPSDTLPEIASLSNLPVGGAGHAESLPLAQSYVTPLANIDPRLLALRTDATPVHYKVCQVYASYIGDKIL